MFEKHCAYLNEITLERTSPPRLKSDYADYWVSMFNNDEESLEKLLKEISGVDLSDLSLMEQDRYGLKNSEVLLSGDDWTGFSNYEQSGIISGCLSESTFYSFFTRILHFSYYKVSLSLMGKSFFRSDQLALSIKYLYKRLYSLSHKALILELNIHRVLGKLEGKTPEERYENFCCYIGTPEFIEDLKENYPSLIRSMRAAADNWIGNVKEIYQRMEQDSMSLKKVFNISIDLLTNIVPGLGDEHNGGKTVTLIEFSDGKKIIYKPRQVGIEHSFHSLTRWINKQLASESNLYSPCVIDRQDYGWVEYIEHKECLTPELIRNYYYKMGSLLGILYSLNAVDFHYENIIAMGTFPVPVDLESLFHHSRSLEEENRSAYGKALHVINRSVRSTGIIPFLAFNSDNPEYRGLDLSGLSDKNSQLYPTKIASIDLKNTDEMHIDSKHAFVEVNESEKNKPVLYGSKISYRKYVDDIVSGFQYIYGWILENKENYIEIIEDTFKDNSVRIILRPTALYGELLNKSKHPDFMQKGYNRDIYFHLLGLENDNKTVEILQREKSDLLNDDIPYFYAKVGSRNLYHGDEACNKDFFGTSPISAVIKKIKGFSASDCSQQINIMRMSFLAHSATSASDKQEINPFKRISLMNASSKDFLTEACRMGDYMISKAVEGTDGNDLCWISTVISSSNEYKWDIYPVDSDLYNGLSGISLFFHYLYLLTGNKNYLQAGQKSIKPVIDTLNTLASKDTFNIGTFSGISGAAYALNHISQITRLPYENLILDTMKLAVRKLPQDSTFDVIDGTAGILQVLISIYKTKPNPTVLPLIEESMDFILNHSSLHHDGNHISWKQKNGLSWIGYSHGTAGIISSLAKGCDFAQRGSVRETIFKAISYENSFYDEKHKNWRLPTRKSHSVAWCHGAPGILLSRLIMKEYKYIYPALSRDIKVSLETTINKAFGHNRSLCHGDFGNLDILLYANKVLQDPSYADYAQSIAHQLLHWSQSDKWKNGVSAGTESFGLMTGLAGMGMGLLQQYNYDFIPSVLRLEESKI